MSTFKSLVKEGIVKKEATCNLRNGETPDGCWALAHGDLERGHILSVSYEAALEDLPKLIIDAFINKFDRKPIKGELDAVLDVVKQNMEIAIEQGRIPS